MTVDRLDHLLVRLRVRRRIVDRRARQRQPGALLGDVAGRGKVDGEDDEERGQGDRRRRRLVEEVAEALVGEGDEGVVEEAARSAAALNEQRTG